MPSRFSPRRIAAAVALALSGPLPCVAQTVPAPDAPPSETAAVKLPDVYVEGTRERDAAGYQGGKSRVGKLDQLPRDIPQSLTIVPRQLMQDRNADSLREALRNVPGLTFNAGEGGRIGDNITLRGYSAVGDLYLDGIRDIAQYNRETFNLEQIDVLRGSASMLFGRGSTGGIINQVSKVPAPIDQFTTALTYGSHDYKRATLDAQQAIGDTAAIRLNAMKTDAGSFRDFVHADRWGVAPSLRFGVDTDDDVTLAYYHLEEENVPDYGVPYFQGKPLDVPVQRFYGLANADREHNRTGIGTATWNHRFDLDSALRIAVRKADYTRDLSAVAPRLSDNPEIIADDTVINRQRQARGGDEHVLTGQTDFTAVRNLAGMDHRLLAGVEVTREDADRWTLANDVPNPSTTVGSPDANPELPPEYFTSVRRTNPVSYHAETVGLYVQDMIELSPDWKLLAGARWDHFDADYERAPPAGPLSRLDRQWSFRTGALYQPTRVSTYYAAFGTSYNPSGELYALDDRTANTPPEKNRNLELGAKWDVLHGELSLRAAIFRSEKRNERNTDLAQPDIALLSGRRHTDGIEFEAAGRITPDWEVFGGIALMRAKIDVASAQQANTEGKAPLNTPDYTANVWTTYRFAPGWKLGGGLEAVGARWANNTNTNEVPAYSRWDAMVEYSERHYALRLNVLNVFDQTYYQGVYAGHVVPGTTRSVQFTVELYY